MARKHREHGRKDASRAPVSASKKTEPHNLSGRVDKCAYSDSKVFELHFPGEVPPMALDRFLRESFEEMSWTRCRGLIETGKVSVDGELCKDIRRIVQSGCTVSVNPRARRTQVGGKATVKLVYRDAQLVIVEKPAGLSTVAFDETETDSLEERTRRALSDLASERCPPLGVVHRIDKETTGLVVFARTTIAKRHLKQQFRFHTNHRVYLALAWGNVRSERIESRLIADRGDGRRGSTKHPTLGQNAITHVEALEHFSDATLVRCQLETGRTHQIRIHLAERGHPLLGERVYGPPQKDGGPGAPRLMLHAAELGITHPTRDERMLFRSELPEDFLAVLARLREGRGA